MKKAYAYARFSSDNQREESIDAQIRAIKQYAESNDIEILKIFKDEAVSAKNDKRPAFLEMINSAQNIDYVIVHKLDRFSRNRYDSAIYKAKLKKKGIKLLSVLENLDDSPESIILESVLEGLNEYYLLNLSREVKKGHKENAVKGKHNGGSPPRGYKLDDEKNLVIDEKEAPGVRKIFNLYVKGYSYNYIIDELKKDGFIYKKSSLYDMLKNEKYKGTYVYNRRLRIGDKYNSHKESPDVIRIENNHKAIIEKDLWDKAQEVRKNNQGKKLYNFNIESENSHIYLLSSVLKHSCGKSMIANEKEKGQYYYSCQNRDCKDFPKNIKADKIENEVLIFLDRIFSNNKDKILEKVYDIFLEVKKEFMEERKDLSNKLKSLEMKKNNLNKIFLKGIDDESLIEEYKNIQDEIKRIKDRIVLLSYISKVDKNIINSKVEPLCSIFNNERELQKEVIQATVKKIIFKDDTFNIFLKEKD